MWAMWAITINTLREVVRQRLFLLIIVLGIAMVALLLLFPFFTFERETEMFKDLALSSTTLVMVFMVALTASSVMAEEIESRTALTVLSKPVSRWQFLTGKFMGVVLSLALAMAIMAVVLFLATYVRVYNDGTGTERAVALEIARDEPARQFQALMFHQALSTIPGAVMIFLQGTVLAAVAVVLSTLTSRVFAVLTTFAVFLLGHLASEFAHDAIRHAPDATRLGIGWLVNLLPALQTFNITSKLSHNALPPGSEASAIVWAYVGWAAIYALLYGVFVLSVGAAIFRRRELN